MNLTTEQQQQLSRGEPVEVEVGGEQCVLLTRQALERVTSPGCDASPWTAGEMDRLAAEAGNAVAGSESGTLSDLIGAWRTTPAPTDDDIEWILEEERIRKHA